MATTTPETHTEAKARLEREAELYKAASVTTPYNPVNGEALLLEETLDDIKSKYTMLREEEDKIKAYIQIKSDIVHFNELSAMCERRISSARAKINKGSPLREIRRVLLMDVDDTGV